MKTFILLGCALSVLGLGGVVSFTSTTPDDWAEQSVSPDATTAAAAQAHLRDSGPDGLLLLQQRYARQIATHQSGARADEQWKRIAAALDKVGGQHDNYASGLFWYTDMEKAKAAARTSGRPILSLRLLGRLDEDLSCANSRFFRTTLYPSAEINQIMKDRYILHWESVRPAPRVTINFGDGRKLERTITGNSIHYILDSHGQVMDALPGLYSAPVFAAELRAAADAMRQPGDTAAHLRAVQSRLLNSWAADLDRLNIKAPARSTWTESELEQRTDDATWRRIAQMHESEATFDARVSELIVRKFPSAQIAAPLAMTKSIMEAPVLRSLTNLQQGDEPKPAATRMASFPTAQSAAPISPSKRAVEAPMLSNFSNSPRIASLRRTASLDTVQNNYMRRAKILAFIAGPARESRLSLAAINNWVYGKVFLTPAEDPWLGLAPPDVFSAIENDGQVR